MRVLRPFPWLSTVLAVLGLTLNSSPLGPTKAAAAAEATDQAQATPRGGWSPERGSMPKMRANAPREVKSEVVLMRSGARFVYPRGCQTAEGELSVVVHFHGAPETVVPRYLGSALDAVLVIVNKGLGSGPYSEAYAVRKQADELLERIEHTVASHCGREPRPIAHLALSSWSAGYGAVEQFLRFMPERVDAILLADGLHVGFTDRRRRVVDERRLSEFLAFAERAGRGERLMAITHSAITPVEYAGAGETARSLARHVGAVETTVHGRWAGMQQTSEARVGSFSVRGFAGSDKRAHSAQLYGVGLTSFASLREYWKTHKK